MKKSIISLFFACFSSLLFAQAPVNDECANAIATPINTALAKTNFVTGTVTGATLSPNIPAGTTPNKDVWYKFTATAPFHILEFFDYNLNATSLQEATIEVVKGDCSNLLDIPIYFTSNNGAQRVMSTEIGKEYRIRIAGIEFDNKPSTLSTFKLCLTTPNLPSSNVTCANPIAFTIPTNGTPIILKGNNFNAVAKALPHNYCTSGGFDEKAVWYNFTAKQNAYTFKFENAISLNTLANAIYLIKIYEGDDCDSLTSFYCDSRYLSSQSFFFESKIDNFKVGKKYRLVVSTNYESPIAYDLSVQATQNSPVNDVCANAKPLTVNGLNSCAILENGFTENCSVGHYDNCVPFDKAQGEIWYSFVAKQKIQDFKFYNVQPTKNLCYQIFSDNCDALTAFDCKKYSTDAQIAGFTIGEKYYLKVRNNLEVADFSYHSFTLCVKEGPKLLPNDDLSAATTLDVNPDLVLAKYKDGTLKEATFSGTNTQCGYLNSGDAYYSFKATNKRHILHFDHKSNTAATVMDSLFNVVECANTSDSLFFLENLTIGKKYFVKVESFGEPEFKIGIITPPVAPANDLCSAAIKVMPSNDWSCKNSVSGSTYYASSKALLQEKKYDVWYSFTATAEKHVVYLENIVGIQTNNVKIELTVKKGNCNQDSTVYLSNTPNNPTKVIGNLTIGQQYFIQISALNPQSFFFFDLCILTPTAQIPNNRCSKAEALKISPTEKIAYAADAITGYKLYSNIDNTPIPMSESVWYKFTATSIKHQVYFYDVKNTISSGTAPIRLKIYEGNCDSLKFLHLLLPEENEIINTIIGKTYFIQVFNEWTEVRGKFKISVTTLPVLPNDDCSGALPLKISSNLKPTYAQIADFHWATDSTKEYTEPDLWYTFVAEKAVHTIQTSSLDNGLTPRIELYKGNCGNFNFYKKIPYSVDSLQLINGLTIGQKYYLKLTYQTNLGLCICKNMVALGTPPVVVTNDDFENATLIIPGAANTCQYNYTNLTWASVKPGDDICTTQKSNVWYKFVAKKDKYLVNIDTIINYVGFTFSYKNAKDSLVVQNGACINFIPFDDISTKKWITNLIVGKTYWICAFSDTKKDTKFCISESPANPANDEYANAITLPINVGQNNCTQKTSASIKYASPSLQDVFEVCDEVIGDVWYKFKAQNDAIYTAKVTYPSNQTGDLLSVNFYKYDSTTQVMASFACQKLEENEVSAQKDETYFVRVSQRSAIDKKIDFDICLNSKAPQSPPKNDECANAIPLTIQNYDNCNGTIYKFDNASPSSDPINCFPNAPDVWFSFVATDTILRLSTEKNLGNGTNNFEVELFKGDDCNNKTWLSCHFNQPKLSGLVIGKKYFLRFSYTWLAVHDCKVCVQKFNIIAPTNDVCSGAVNIPVNITKNTTTFLSGNNHFSKNENTALTNTICGSNNAIENDVWYKFTATKKSHFVRLYEKTPFFKPKDLSSFYVNLQIFKGNCNAGFTPIICTPPSANNTETYELDNLTVGETYYIRLVSNEINEYFSYKIAILERTLDNNCSNPTTIQYNKTYIGNTLTTSVHLPWMPDTFSQKMNLTWYKFKAEENQAIVKIDTTESLGLFANPMSVFVLKTPCMTKNQEILGEISLNSLGKKSILVNGLQKDSSYYLVFAADKNEVSAFRFVLEKANLSAVNDKCIGALTIPISPNMVANTVLKDSIDTRFSNVPKTKFYKFKATAKNQILYCKKITNRLTTYPFFLYYNCDSVQQTLYNPSDSLAYLINLTIGKEYRIEVQSEANASDKSLYNLAILTPPTPPANDECSGAISLDAATTAAPNCANSINIKLKNASPDTMLFASGSNESNYQWFYFTAKASNQRLNFSNIVVSNLKFFPAIDVQLAETSNCTQFKIVKSDQFYLADTSNTVTLNNLTVGKKYYMALSLGDWQAQSSFNFCMTALPQSPANDLCENATNLTPVPNVTNTNATNGTLKYAFAEKQSTKYLAASDVWYSFTATADYHRLYVEKAPFTTIFGEFRDESCDKVGTEFELNSKYTDLQDLIVGKKYRVGIKTSYADTTQSANFKIAIVSPNVLSQNNKCTKAIALPVSATANVQQFVNSDLQYNNELWYKFVATAKAHRIYFASQTPLLQSGSVFSPTVKGFFERKNNCTDVNTTPGFNLSDRYLNNITDTLSNDNIVSGLTIGATYYLEISNLTNGLNDASLPFKIGISTVNAPNNIACYLAKQLPVNPDKNLNNFLSENSKGLFSQDQFALATGSLFYEFTATTKRHQVVFKDLSTDVDYYASMWYEVYEGNCQSTSLITSAYVPNFKEEDEILNNLIVGKKYYVFCHLEKRKIVYDGKNIPNIDMTFKVGVITHPPAPNNDNCKDAKIAVVNNNPQCQQVTKGTTLNATKDIDAPCFQEGADDNVWFKFTATSDLHFIQLKNIKPIIGDVIEMGYAIYSDNICDFPFENPIGCSVNKTYSIAPWKLEIGKTYYISVYTRYVNAFSQCEFDLCISTPIANDDVKGAILVQNTGNIVETGAGFKSACANPVTGSSVGATYSFDSGVPIGACNIGALPKDIWFKTVVGTKRNLAIQVLQSPAGASVQMVAYKLKNGVLTLLPSRCPADTLKNLTQGDTIALRVWDANGTAFGNYTLCIEAFGKTTSSQNIVCTPVAIHPIPTSDYLNFGIDYITEPTFNIRITNINGSTVLQKTVSKASTYNDVYTIDVRHLPAGTYILSVSDGKKLFSKKFLKM